MFLSFIWCKGSDIFWDYQIKSRLFLNKTHFYCFLPSLSTDFTDFTDFFVIITGRTGWTGQLATMYRLVKSGASGVFLSSTDFADFTDLIICVICVICWLFVAHPGARTWCHALPWWALCCRYPLGPQQPQTKILRLWSMFPPMELNHRNGRAGRGMG